MKTSGLNSSTVSITVYPEAEQGSGAFDGGKITEIKPIPFPQESGGSRRIGPLLYWAWATAHGDGVIGMHPHQGFEIMSYVFEGSVGHTDSAGNSSRVSAGGAQVMQTGSGISHQEEMHGERTDFFQIWFEPDLRQSLRKQPVYGDFEDSDFPHREEDGVRIKQVIGGDGPVLIDAPVQVEDIHLAPGASHSLRLPAHHALASVVVAGSGRWGGDGLETLQEVSARDFAVLKTGEEVDVTLCSDDGLRVVNVITPLRVDYPLQF